MTQLNALATAFTLLCVVVYTNFANEEIILRKPLRTVAVDM